MPLKGFTDAETTIMAAAYYYAVSADVDWDKVVSHVGSASVHSVKERIRQAKKKVVESGELKDVVSPSGGVDKKSPGNVNSKTPKKATAKKRSSPKKKMEEVKIYEDPVEEYVEF